MVYNYRNITSKTVIRIHSYLRGRAEQIQEKERGITWLMAEFRGAFVWQDPGSHRSAA